MRFVLLFPHARPGAARARWRSAQWPRFCPALIDRHLLVASPPAHRPDLVEPRKMEEFMVFCTVFLGSTHYVKNAYLR